MRGLGRGLWKNEDPRRIRATTSGELGLSRLSFDTSLFIYWVILDGCPSARICCCPYLWALLVGRNRFENLLALGVALIALDRQCARIDRAWAGQVDQGPGSYPACLSGGGL